VRAAEVAGRPFPPHTVTYLEMTARPPETGPAPEGLSLVRSEAPPAWWFLALYDAVGRDHHWFGMHAEPEAEVEAWIGHERAELWVLQGRGWPQGFVLLDGAAPPRAEIAYFGLVPEAVGRGWGRWFLAWSVSRAWSLPGTERVTVNTCTLDHPRALPTYLAAGFEPVRTEERPGGADPC
jgi:GNAT superfamily N-acetyltransferase